MYVGYANYGGNTGPINVRYYDPAAGAGAGAFSDALVTADTDAINRFHTGPDGKVYALYTDPVGRISGAYASGQAGASSGWSKETSTYGVHFFDMVIYARDRPALHGRQRRADA